MEVNGFQLFQHPLFNSQFEKLLASADKVREQQQETYKEHPTDYPKWLKSFSMLPVVNFPNFKLAKRADKRQSKCKANHKIVGSNLMKVFLMMNLRNSACHGG